MTLNQCVKLLFVGHLPKAIQNSAWKHTALVTEMAVDRSRSTASRDPRMLQEELKLPIAAPFRALSHRICHDVSHHSESKRFKFAVENEIRPVTGKYLYL